MAYINLNKLPYITLDGFSPMVPNKELYSKGWTRKMIDTLGPSIRKNPDGVPMWPRERVEATITTPAFTKELIKALKAKTPMLYKITPETILLACETLYDLNKHVKDKAFSAGDVQRSYRMKLLLLSYLLENGYVTEVARETDTNLFRLTVQVEGRTFVWHQPPNQAKYFITDYVETTSTPDVEDAPVKNPKATAVYATLEAIVISILVATLQAKLDASMVG